jgi:RNA polymerase sigma factor (TIGR02999 family)
LLQKVDSGALPPLQELVPIVYEELRRLAHRQLAGESRKITLQTTALVHEAYFRLAGDMEVTARGRAYFFAAAARAMRQVLVDAARRRGAVKRGGGETPVTIDELPSGVDAYASDILDLDSALNDLERFNPRHVRVVECRFFGGMSVDETAAALGVSPRTIKADWALARSWLHRTLAESRS